MKTYNTLNKTQSENLFNEFFANHEALYIEDWFDVDCMEFGIYRARFTVSGSITYRVNIAIEVHGINNFLSPHYIANISLELTNRDRDEACQDLVDEVRDQIARSICYSEREEMGIKESFIKDALENLE